MLPMTMNALDPVVVGSGAWLPGASAVVPPPGATPPARPGMPPEGVLAVVCLDNPRDNTRGKALGLRCLHWDPRRNAHGVCQMLYRHGWSVTL